MLVREDRQAADRGQPAGHSTGRPPSRSPDDGPDEKWSEAALVLDGCTYTLADLVLVAVLSEQWDGFATRVVGRKAGAPIDSGDVTQGVIAFRRARRLEAAADLRTWLSERDVAQDDLFAFVRSRLAAEASTAVEAPPRTAAQNPAEEEAGAKPSTSSEGTPWWPEAVLSGDVERWATTLQHWWAAQALLRARGTPTAGTAPDRARLLEQVRASSALRVIGPVEDQRLREMVDLSVDYLSWRDLAIDEPEIDRLITRKRLDWSWYWYDLILFKTESAVREAALCIRHDGEEIAGVVARAGATIESRRILLQDLGPDERAALVSLVPDGLGGPLVIDGRLVLVRLRAVSPPDRHRAEIRQSARQELADDALTRFASGKAQRVGRW